MIRSHRSILRRFEDLPLKIKGVIVVAGPLMLIMSALALVFLADRQSTIADNQVRLTLAIQSDIQEIHAHIAEAATGVRGYLLTGNKTWLAPYERAKTALPTVIARMGQQLADPEQKQRLSKVRIMIDKKLASLERLRAVASADALARQELAGLLTGSKKDLDILRAEIDAMVKREAELLALRTNDADQVRTLSRGLLVAAALLGLTGSLAAVALFSKGIVRRVHALEGMAHRLAHGERVGALDPAKDEIGHLEQALQNASTLLKKREHELRQSERNLIAAREEALRASQAKSEFLSRMSHELRTPLNSILGFAQLLELDAKDEVARDNIEQILRAGRHLLTLIGDVLDLARIEAGRMDLTIEPHLVPEILTEAATLARPLAQARQIRIDVSNPSGADLTALADRRRLLQILLNLLSNAVKYNHESGHVVLAFRPLDETLVRITVLDSGPGIPPERAAGLFLDFDRLGAERSVVEGSGLGLALSRQLADAMGGSLAHDNRREGGSAFHLDLPLAKRHQSEADGRTGGKHVSLMVEGQWPEANADAP
ncbi:CHASE3 domain-containing protein [Sinorhizobium numidicum]|uniref:histidine kinase n=1 Tax=Sinorhizobium numidicum TaxID=680248 RepID=A0ABY8CR67_9HYPH|nr:ATP-binding protein [Sinorhizobium numidicum]WEX75146.1 CHASE3 domain-containing protein [Sinorhizobium numidicum]WEX81140.1 CHASE3 domain-containing protein [Sinorhizobium numidicum]